MSSTELQNLYVDETCAMGRIKGLAIVAWRTGVTESAFAQCTRMMEQMLGTQPQIGIATIIEKGAKPPEGSVRTRIASWCDTHAGQLGFGSSNTLEGDGMWASTVRVVLRTLRIATKANYPLEIFARHEEAAKWHAELSKGALTVNQVSSAIVAVRAATMAQARPA